jgi:hypothetical protein
LTPTEPKNQKNRWEIFFDAHVVKYNDEVFTNMPDDGGFEADPPYKTLTLTYL